MTEGQNPEERRATRLKLREAQAQFLKESQEKLEAIGNEEDADLVQADVENRLRALRTNIAAVSGLNTEKVEKLKSDLSAGGKFSARALHQVMMLGSQKEKVGLRALFLESSVQSRNQDLILPHIAPALRGRKASRVFIERHRIVMAETLPGWIQQRWKDEANAEWRKIDLFDQRVTNYIRKEFGPGPRIRPQCRYKMFHPYREDASREISLAEASHDLRGSMYTMLAVSRLMDRLVDPRMLKGEMLYEWMKREVEEDFFSSFSPTIVGKLCREKMLHEMRAMFAAMLIEDVVVALGLPADEILREQVWEEVRSEPWKLASHELVVCGPHLAATLRSKGLQEEELVESFSELISDQKEVTALKDQMFGLREVRRDLPANADPREEHPSIAMRGGRNRRLELSASLESFRDSIDDADRYARILSKFVGDDDEMHLEVIKAIESGVDLDNLVAELREQRPLRRKGREKHEAPAPLPRQLANVCISGWNPPVEPLQFTFTSEAVEAMTDGSIRHAVAYELDKFAESPMLADRKRIKGVDQVWELRVLSVGARVYFLTERNGVVPVILVGKKKDQDRDIRRLASLRDRVRPKPAGLETRLFDVAEKQTANE